MARKKTAPPKPRHGGRRPGSGRRPEAETARQRQIFCRLTEEELEIVRRAAQAGGLPLGTWVRRLVLAAAQRPDSR